MFESNVQGEMLLNEVIGTAEAAPPYPELMVDIPLSFDDFRYGRDRFEKTASKP